jgi:hypothetical protein
MNFEYKYGARQAIERVSSNDRKFHDCIFRFKTKVLIG